MLWKYFSKKFKFICCEENFMSLNLFDGTQYKAIKGKNWRKTSVFQTIPADLPIRIQLTVSKICCCEQEIKSEIRNKKFEQRPVVEKKEQKFVQSTPKQRKMKQPAVNPLKAKEQLDIKK